LCDVVYVNINPVTYFVKVYLCEVRMLNKHILLGGEALRRIWGCGYSPPALRVINQNKVVTGSNDSPRDK